MHLGVEGCVALASSSREGLLQSLADASSGGSKPDVQFVNVLMAQADQRFHLPCQSIE